MKLAKGIGTFRVTVTRIDGGTHSGHHELDVAAGSWIAALKAAATVPGEFSYERPEPPAAEPAAKIVDGEGDTWVANPERPGLYSLPRTRYYLNFTPAQIEARYGIREER